MLSWLCDFFVVRVVVDLICLCDWLVGIHMYVHVIWFYLVCCVFVFRCTSLFV